MAAHGIENVGPRGLIFRSLAESRWAEIMDRLNWSWEYEPDLGLSGYIPDFIVNLGGIMLIEVKGGVLSLAELDQHSEKIKRSGWMGRFLIVGSRPFDDILGLYYRPGEERWVCEPVKLASCDQIICESGGEFREMFIGRHSNWSLLDSSNVCFDHFGLNTHFHVPMPKEFLENLWINVQNMYRYLRPGEKRPRSWRDMKFERSEQRDELLSIARHVACYFSDSIWTKIKDLNEWEGNLVISVFTPLSQEEIQAFSNHRILIEQAF